MIEKTLFVTLFAAAALGLAATGASANTVKACSKGGIDCIVKEVRKAPLGQQYKTSAGHWVYCTGDCRDSIRRNYIDFWVRHGG